MGLKHKLFLVSHISHKKRVKLHSSLLYRSVDYFIERKTEKSDIENASMEDWLNTILKWTEFHSCFPLSVSTFTNAADISILCSLCKYYFQDVKIAMAGVSRKEKERRKVVTNLFAMENQNWHQEKLVR